MFGAKARPSVWHRRATLPSPLLPRRRERVGLAADPHHSLASPAVTASPTVVKASSARGDTMWPNTEAVACHAEPGRRDQTRGGPGARVVRPGNTKGGADADGFDAVVILR
jgi:hypothetical protein